MADVVQEFLSNYPEEIRRISAELRDMARKAMPQAHEFLYYDAVTYSLDSSPLGRIVYISPMEKYVTVGFLFGAQLSDQHHLLQGVGKRARHVKIRTLGEAKNPAIKELVRAAWSHGTDPVLVTHQQTRRPTSTHNRGKGAQLKRLFGHTG